MAKPQNAQACCVAYLDLLAYGSLLQAGSAQLDSPPGQLAIERLATFHRCPLLDSPLDGVTVRRINDALILNCDLEQTAANGRGLSFEGLHGVYASRRGWGHYVRFIEWVRRIHDRVRADQRLAGYPGARSVVVLATRKPTQHGDLPELQMNMAFALAYKVGELGTKVDISGDFLYVELFSYFAALGIVGGAPPKSKEIEKEIVRVPNVLGRDLVFLRCHPPVGARIGQNLDVTQPTVLPGKFPSGLQK